MIHEVESDSAFHQELFVQQKRFLDKEPSSTSFMFLHPRAGSEFFPYVLIYALVRLLQPEIVVETGGTPGTSSAFILQAMRQNGCGRLVTLDLPDWSTITNPESEAEKHWYAHMPQHLPPGWMVPGALQDRWEQVLGDARETLGGVMETYPEIDLFIHDSDHSYNHMLWEYRTAWPHIRAGGMLYSDDIALNTAFPEFAREVGQSPLIYDSYHIGVIKKPAP